MNMTTLEKMKILTDSAQYDLCDYVNHNKSSQINLPGIYEAIGHDGCKIPLFKTLLTNKCKNDCKYCINQSKRNFTRLELSPEELAKAFLGYYNRGMVNGLFLSSGISGDVDFDAVEPIVAAITPVPGGVGTVTSSVLISHVIEAAKRTLG